MQKQIILLSAWLFSGCNIFSPFDDPTNNAQLISKARACFDEGDLKCARENYSKVEGTTYDDLRASERAFAVLDEEGAGLEDFIKAFRDSNGGTALTSLASAISYGAGENKRKRIFEAYQETMNIAGNSQLRGLVRFITSLVFAAEILAEDVGDNSQLDKSDLVRNPNACMTGGIIGCATGPSCGSPMGDKIQTGAELIVGEPNPFVVRTREISLTGDPTLYMLSAAIQAANYAINIEIGSSGKLSGDKIGKFTGSVNISQGPACFRYLMINNGVGVDL